MDERLRRYKDVPHSSIRANSVRPDLEKPDNWGMTPPNGWDSGVKRHVIVDGVPATD